MVYTTSAVVAANCWIFLIVDWVFSDSLTSITGGGLTWTAVQARPNPIRDPRNAVVRAWAPSGLASSTAITLTWTGGDIANKQVIGCSFSGGDASSFDSAITAASGNSTALSLSYTTDTDGELIIASAGHETGAADTPTSPATEIVEDTTTGATFLGLWRTQTTAGAGTIAGTWTFAGEWGIMGIRMNPAGAIATAPFIPRRMPLGV
jgi:hypothetical protein